MDPTIAIILTLIFVIGGGIFVTTKLRVKPSAVPVAKNAGAEAAPLANEYFAPADISDMFYAAAFDVELQALQGEPSSNISKIANYLQGQDCDEYLPRQPLVLPRLMKAVRDPKADARDMVNILTEDAALTAEVLKMANSPYYRNSTDPIESVESALVLIGANGLRTLMLNAMMRPAFNLSDRVFQRFTTMVWEQALISADTAQAYASESKDGMDFSAQLLALMVNMSQIILVRFARQTIDDSDYVSLVKLLEKYQKPVVLALIRSWNLGGELEEAAVDYYDNRRQGLVASATYYGICMGQLSQLYKHGLVDLEQMKQLLIYAGMEGALLDKLMPGLESKLAA